MLALNNAHSPSILLVEDDITYRFLIREVLLQHNLEVHEAENGEVGLAMLTNSSQSFDLVISDAMMPVMNGFDMCKALRQKSQFRYLPVLMMTGLDDDDSIDRAYESGVTDFINKPFNTALLIKKLRYLLRNAEVTQQLAISEQRLSRLKEIAKVGGWEWRPEWDGFINWSPFVVEKLQFDASPNDYSLADLLARVVEADKAKVKAWFDEAKQGLQPNSLTYEVSLPSGDSLYLYQEVEHVLDDEGQLLMLIGIVQDITAMKQTQQRVEFLSFYDPITGLANKASFHNAFEQAYQSTRSDESMGAVISLAMQEFDLLVDQLGHDQANQVMKRWVLRLEQALKEVDQTRFSEVTTAYPMASVLFRISGNKFAVLLKQVESIKQVDIYVNAIEESVKLPIPDVKHHIVLPALLGISLFPQDGHSAEEALQNSHLALSHASRSGVHRQYFSKTLLTSPPKRMEMESLLPYALTHNEMQVVYFPEVALNSGKVMGAEAKLVWNSSQIGWVPEEKFLSLADNVGIREELDNWLLRAVCKQIKNTLINVGHAPKVSLRIGGKQLIERQFLAQFKSVIDELSLGMNGIELILTEQDLLYIATQVDHIALFTELNKVGISLCMSGYGSGYSGLTYLHQLPIQKLQLDHALIEQLGSSESDLKLFKSIMLLAQHLDIQVVASGIKKQATIDALVEHGYLHGKGPFFGKAIPFSDLPI